MLAAGGRSQSGSSGGSQGGFWDDDDYYPNPSPALPIFNDPTLSKQLEASGSVVDQIELPFEEWAYNERIRQPPVHEIAGVYKSRREAWRRTKWVHCKEFLGSGGFGKVYLGFRWEDRHSKEPLMKRRLCAIKQVEIRKGNVDQIDERIATENYILRSCVHANIVRLFNSYCIPSRNQFFFVLEYADSKDLFHEIFHGNSPRAPPLWEEYSRSLFKGMVEGIVYLHDKGVGHCDIKPENVLVRISPDGQNKIPKWTDFGLSTIFKGKMGKDGQRELLVETKPMGTMRYMAPVSPHTHFFCQFLFTHLSFFFMKQELLFLKYKMENLDHLKKFSPIPVSKADTSHKLFDKRVGRARRYCVMLDEYKKRIYRPYQTDVYALGVTLYIMQAGMYPYDVGPAADLDLVFRREPVRNAFHLGSHTFNFICEMLEPNLEKRLTITEIKNHEWFMGPTSGPGNPPKRLMPKAAHAVYVTPTPTPTKSLPRSEDTIHHQQLDPNPPSLTKTPVDDEPQLRAGSGRGKRTTDDMKELRAMMTAGMKLSSGTPSKGLGLVKTTSVGAGAAKGAAAPLRTASLTALAGSRARVDPAPDPVPVHAPVPAPVHAPTLLALLRPDEEQEEAKRTGVRAKAAGTAATTSQQPTYTSTTVKSTVVPKVVTSAMEPEEWVPGSSDESPDAGRAGSAGQPRRKPQQHHRTT